MYIHILYIGLRPGRPGATTARDLMIHTWRKNSLLGCSEMTHALPIAIASAVAVQSTSLVDGLTKTRYPATDGARDTNICYRTPLVWRRWSTDSDLRRPALGTRGKKHSPRRLPNTHQHAYESSRARDRLEGCHRRRLARAAARRFSDPHPRRRQPPDTPVPRLRPPDARDSDRPTHRAARATRGRCRGGSGSACRPRPRPRVG